MKKILFLPLLFLALFTISSCGDGDDPTPKSELTETEQNLFGNWKMNSEDYKFYDASGAVIHTTGQSDLNYLFEYKADGTLRYKIGQADWDTRKYNLELESNPKMLNVYNAAGNEIAIPYKIQKLTATEMVLVHEYDENVTYEKDGQTYEAARAVKTYNYTKLP